LEAVLKVDPVLEIAYHLIGHYINCNFSAEITSDRDIIGEGFVRGSVSICTSVQHAFLKQKHLFNEKEHLLLVVNSDGVYIKSTIYLLFL
jgi:Na+-translocating ferredoxin:NAD+ oxidoreductase RnfE subunit